MESSAAIQEKKTSEGVGKVIMMFQKKKKFLCREVKAAGLAKYLHTKCRVYSEVKRSHPPHTKI